MNKINRYSNFASAYKGILNDIMRNPEYVCSPRGMKINEILLYNFTISNPYSNLFKNEIRSLPLDYLANELILYFSSTNRIEYFEKASSFWKKIANKDGTVNSAYGHLIFSQKDVFLKKFKSGSQFDWVIANLITDKDSRQAIMHFNKPMHQNMVHKDFPCTMSAQFFIRDNKLHTFVYMRSSDLFFGIPYDISFFTILQQCILKNLQKTYPKLKMGEYNHLSGSLHAYEKDFNTFYNMLDQDFISDSTPKVNENLVLNPNIIKLCEDSSYNYNGKDEFIKWLNKNKKF